MIHSILLIAQATVCGALITAQGPSPHTADQLIEQGRQALTSREYDVACIALERAVEESPEDPRAWSLLGRSMLGKADLLPSATEEEWASVEPIYVEAERHLRRAIDLDEANPDLWADLGRVMLRQADASEAIATFYHAQSLGNDSIDLLVDLADAQMLAYEYANGTFNVEEAQHLLDQAYETLLQANEGLKIQSEVLRRLGTVSLQRGEPGAALKHLRRAIALVPEDDGLHTAHLQAIERQHAFDAAIDFYTGLVEDPARALWYGSRAHQLKGHFKYNKDLDYEAATTEYKIAEEKLFQSSELEPDFEAAVTQWIPLVRSYRGYALMKSGKFDEAEAAFLSALDRSPELKNAKQGLADIMNEKFGRAGKDSATPDEFDKLRAYAARVCIVDPKNATAWNNYGFFAREAQKYEESYQAYRRAIEIEPDNARFLNDTALILLYHLGRDLDMAEQWLLDARDISEEQYYSGETDDPMDWVKETYGDSLINLIVLYHKTDNLGRARDVYYRVEEELPERAELRMWSKRLSIPDAEAPPAEPAPAAEVPPAATEVIGENGESPPPVLGDGTKQ